MKLKQKSHTGIETNIPLYTHDECLEIEGEKRKQVEDNCKERLRFESLITKLSTRFINLPSDRIDAEIVEAQQLICDYLDIDLSVLWQWDLKSDNVITITHLYGPPDGPELPVGIDGSQAFPWSLDLVLKGETFVCHTDEMPPEAEVDIESRIFFGVKSSTIVPLSAGGGPLLGVLSFDTLREKRVWQESVIKKFKLVADIFANAIARKRSDVQLKESQTRLELATEASGVGLWVMDIKTGHVWVTPRIRELFQFSSDEALSDESFYKRTHPDCREQLMSAVKTSSRTDEGLRIEYRIVLSDGTSRWIISRGKRMTGSPGEPERLMGVSIDLSERKSMEEQLKAQLKEINDLKQKLEAENIYLRKEIELQHIHEKIVGRSAAMHRILEQAEQVARTETSVLIEGETGTGKELMARTVHRLSNRGNRPLMTVNCASLPPTLVESELFGREKGAYTGALTKMAGRFEEADGATLFLDEIGELPLEAQAKLLRVLEEGRFERLGSTREIQVDVRIIAATNQDLERQVSAGRFRSDLYYRLNVFPILLPPLRDRREDIPPLVWHFVRQYEKKMGRRIDRISHKCMNDLQRYDWPGNARELRNVIERALIISSGRTLKVSPPQCRNSIEKTVCMELDEVNRRHIISVLNQTGWKLSGKGGAADILGLKRTTLQSKMKKLGIRRFHQ